MRSKAPKFSFFTAPDPTKHNINEGHNFKTPVNSRVGEPTKHNFTGNNTLIMLTYRYTFAQGVPGSNPEIWKYFPVYIPAESLPDALQKWYWIRKKIKPDNKYYDYLIYLQIRAVTVHRPVSNNRLAALAFEPINTYLQTGINSWSAANPATVGYIPTPQKLALYE